ncbi:putative sulfate exporter family transporter [Treponema brennaborense]|uniref:putative sulfate exporter family transporter n=1 Tax=Treponema brennaborense TaxID=81028 RepID=UPI0002E395D5|nr:putative sulfate exporter family transporter [Treponema brennaborense]
MKTENTLRGNALFFTAIVCVAGLALASSFLANLIPYHLISAGVFAMLAGMAIHPLLAGIGLTGRGNGFEHGVQFVSKRILKAGIILM